MVLCFDHSITLFLFIIFILFYFLYSLLVVFTLFILCVKKRYVVWFM